MSNTFRLSGRSNLSETVSVARYAHRSGLTALVCADPSTPLCAVQTWYRVGSANEQRGQTGIAHLFEHLMFNRTSTVATGEFDRLIEQVGGDCNAATWVDWTSYSITVPASELDLALRLEADRMVNLCLDEEVLEAEREVVLNERLERVDDDISGFLDEKLGALAFRVHPYGRPVIGFEQDIRRLDLETILDFYQSYYAPNNAVIVVCGGIDEVSCLETIEEHFGELPPGIPAVRNLSLEPAQESERRESYIRETRADRVVLGYKIPAQTDPDWPALAALAGLLSGGPSARLTRSLVAEKELATYVDCEVLPFADPTLFRVAIGGTLGTGAEALNDALDDAIEAIGRRAPITDLEMEKVKSSLETDFWIELETADGRAEAFGHYETAHGDYGALFDIAKRLREVRMQDIERVARTYLVRERRSIVSATGNGR